MKYIKDSYSSRLLNSPEINVDSTWLRRNRGFPGSSGVKNLSAMQEPREMWVGSIPGSGRSPGGGYGNLLLYPSLENPMDRGAWQVMAIGLQSRI